MGASNRDVVVIGAGVVGATTAWTLADRGWNVELWSDRPTTRTTSVVAAAVWRPYRAAPEAKVLGWAKRTFDVLEELSAIRESAVLMRQGIELGRAMMSDPPWHRAVRSFRHARQDELRPGFIDGLVYTVPVVTMSDHLPWLLRGLTARGGPDVKPSSALPRGDRDRTAKNCQRDWSGCPRTRQRTTPCTPSGQGGGKVGG